jgi:hypothetical protein
MLQRASSPINSHPIQATIIRFSTRAHESTNAIPAAKSLINQSPPITRSHVQDVIATGSSASVAISRTAQIRNHIASLCRPECSETRALNSEDYFLSSKCYVHFNLKVFFILIILYLFKKQKKIFFITIKLIIYK